MEGLPQDCLLNVLDHISVIDAKNTLTTCKAIYQETDKLSTRIVAMKEWVTTAAGITQTEAEMTMDDEICDMLNETFNPNDAPVDELISAFMDSCSHEELVTIVGSEIDNLPKKHRHLRKLDEHALSLMFVILYKDDQTGRISPPARVEARYHLRCFLRLPWTRTKIWSHAWKIIDGSTSSLDSKENAENTR